MDDPAGTSATPGAERRGLRRQWAGLGPLVAVALAAHLSVGALVLDGATDGPLGARSFVAGLADSGTDAPATPDSAMGGPAQQPTDAPSVAGRAVVPAVPMVTPTPSQPTSTAPAEVPDARLTLLGSLLDQRAAALLAKDRAGWLAAVDPRAKDFLGRQRTAFAGLGKLPVGLWAYTVVSVGPPLPADVQRRLGADAWVARVEMRYRLEGYDTADIRRDQYLTVVSTPTGWRLAGDDHVDSAGHRTARDIWDFGAVQVVQGKRSLVIGRRPAERLQGYVSDADASVRRTADVWPDGWGRRVVVLVPDTQEEMRHLTGSESKGLDQIAAVTTGQFELADSSATDRVIVNPATYGTLGQLGRQVVMTHEVTHVATRQFSRSWTPIWLSEGFADYVGYKDSGVPVRVAAQELLLAVRDGDGPRSLPDEGAFDATRGDIAPSYEGAWMACRLIAEQYGEEALVRFYRTAGGDGGEEGAAAVRQAWAELGTTQRKFVQQWQSYLEDAA